MQTLTKIGNYNAYVYTPAGYDGKTKMPCLIAVPGNGEVGSNASLMNTYLPCKFIAAGFNPNMLVICVQPATIWPQASWLKAMYDLIVSSYAVDITRVYGTGYSAGGTVWDAFAIQYPSLVTAIFSLSSPAINSGPADAPLYQPWAKAGGHLWVVTGGNDNSNGLGMAVDSMNQVVPGSAVYTEVPGEGHCCWNVKYDPVYKPNGVNAYDWMLQYSIRQTSFPIPPIPAPIPMTIKSILITYNDGSTEVKP